MTRQQYEQQYGVKPVIATSSVLDDERPAPIRMTRAEYNAIYSPEQEPNPDSLSSKLMGRGKDVVDAVNAKGWEAMPGRPLLRVLGAGAGAIADVASAAIAPILGKAQETLAETSTVEKIANNKTVGKGLDTINSTIDFVSDSWKSFEKSSPTIAQDIKDVANIASIIPGTKAIKPVVTKADDLIAPLKKGIEDRGVKNVVDEIAKLENKYVKTRNANTYEKDVDISRTRIAESNVLADAVDADGVIRTKGVGGAIDQYKKQTIFQMEDVVKRNLDEAKEVMEFADVRKALIREIGKSGLEGADLVAALKKVDSEIAGLAVRTRGSSVIDLGVLHDAKIATTKNINYQTPPEKATYRKAIARAYKTLVEEKSTKFNVKEVNETLAKYYRDIARLERLDGARAEGGRLGKYTASLVGTGIGMAAGSTAGGFGAAIGGVIGGEAAQALKGTAMSRTFKGGGKGLAKDPVLVKAKLSIPDKVVKAKADLPKTKEIKEVESQIAKNVADQKKAIKAGDFTLVQALKEVYTALVEELKKLVKEVVESAKNPTIGMSIKRTISPEKVAADMTEGDLVLFRQIADGKQVDPLLKKDLLKQFSLDPKNEEAVQRFFREALDEYHERWGGVNDADIENLKVKSGTLNPKNFKTAEEYVNANTFYRGEGGSQGGGNYYTKSQPFAAEFAGIKPISEKQILEIDIFRPRGDDLPFAGNEAEVTKAITEAKKAGKKAVYLSEGTPFGEPVESVFVFDKTAIRQADELIDLWKTANR